MIGLSPRIKRINISNDVNSSSQNLIHDSAMEKIEEENSTAKDTFDSSSKLN